MDEIGEKDYGTAWQKILRHLRKSGFWATASWKTETCARRVRPSCRRERLSPQRRKKMKRRVLVPLLAFPMLTAMGRQEALP